MFSSNFKYDYIFLTGKQDKILNCNASPDKYTDERRTRQERLLVNLLHDVKQHLTKEVYFHLICPMRALSFSVAAHVTSQTFSAQMKK